MSFNPSKCHILYITRKKHPILTQYSLSGEALTGVKSHPYLGVQLSDDTHINYATSKAGRVLGVIRRNLTHCPSRVKATCYKALVRPYLEYSANVWDPYTTKGIQTVEAVQRRAARSADRLQLSALTDEDEHVRYEASLYYQAHPHGQQVDMAHQPIEPGIHNVTSPAVEQCNLPTRLRTKRGLSDRWKGISFLLEAPGVDWKKIIGSSTIGASFGVIVRNRLDLAIAPISGHFEANSHNEIFARAHLGMLGINLDLLVVRMCFRGETSYNLNLLQEELTFAQLYERLVAASEFQPYNFKQVLSRSATVHFFCNDKKIGRGTEVYSGLQVGQATKQFGCFIRMEVDNTAAPTEAPRPKSVFEEFDVDEIKRLVSQFDSVVTKISQQHWRRVSTP
ncbi:Hypp6491 [Branchiostoma lanceolatum]|uniref:Hypp6491 protein n=1 Tax=Branchiostoma lanceolatum TaxID=7740 RepID=A0A8J9YUT3_BRALA|nr:Hypp6491 [Branchiostoma lanceolatum]